MEGNRYHIVEPLELDVEDVKKGLKAVVQQMSPDEYREYADRVVQYMDCRAGRIDHDFTALFVPPPDDSPPLLLGRYLQLQQFQICTNCQTVLAARRKRGWMELSLVEAVRLQGQADLWASEVAQSIHRARKATAGERGLARARSAKPRGRKSR